MASATRTAGKRGRLPARRLPLRFVHEYAPGSALPPAVYPVDVSGGIEDWGMLGNGPDPTCTTHPDGVGDCTFAGREHYRMAKAAAGAEAETWETSDALVAEYLEYDHGQDQGANIADLLLAWYQAGKILAFAPVDHTSAHQVDAAVQAFHGVYAGVSLTDYADQLFSEGRPWTVARGQQPDPAEGHCIVKVKAEGGAGYDTWVTWGALQDSTPVWTSECLDEAWVVITSEDEAARIDLAALRADIEALHGTGGQPPQPPPGSRSHAQSRAQPRRAAGRARRAGARGGCERGPEPVRGRGVDALSRAVAQPSPQPSPPSGPGGHLMIKFLKSFPFLSSSFVQAALAMAVALGFHLTAVQTGSIEAAAAAVLAVLTAPLVLPNVVPLFLGALTAIGALLVAFRLPHVTSSEVSAFVTALAALLGSLGHMAVQNKLLLAERRAARQPVEKRLI